MTLAQQFRTLRILHGALLASIVIYVVIAFVTPLDVKPTGDPVIFAIPMAVACVVIQGFAAFFRRQRLRLGEPGDSIDLERAATEPESRALGVLRTVSILTWALCESCAIFGLVLTFTFGTRWYVVPFAALGAGSMIAYLPTRGLFEAVLRGAGRG